MITIQGRERCQSMLGVLSAAGFLLLILLPAVGAESVSYAIMPGSITTDDCLICGRPTIPEPTTGGFQLRLVDQTFPNTIYAIEGLVFDSFLGDTVRHHGTGSGTLVLGGDFTVTQTVTLSLQVDDGTGPKAVQMTNVFSFGTKQPNFVFQVAQSNGTLVHTFSANWTTEPVLPAAWRWVSVSATEGVIAWPASLGAATVQRRSLGGVAAPWSEVAVTLVEKGPVEFRGRVPLDGAGGLFRLHWSGQ